MKYLELFSSVGLIEPYITTTHDPRPKFIGGMELGGIGFNINLDMLDFVFCVCALLSLFLK
jgi:hypothetical protein